MAPLQSGFGGVLGFPGVGTLVRSRRLLLLAASLACALSLGTGAPAAWCADVPEAALAKARAAATRLGSPDPGRRSGALAELEVLARREAAALEGAVDALGQVLRSRPPGEAARAVRLLARAPGPRARALWLGALRGGQPLAVNLAALDGAPARSGDPRALRALLDQARDPAGDLADRALALEGLGALGGPLARWALARPLSPEGGPEAWLLAAGRARGLGRLGGGGAVSSLIEILGHPDPAPRVHAWEALTALTGRALPAALAPWAAWWSEAWSEEGVREERPAEAAPVDVRGRYEAPAPAHVPTHYGIPIPRARSRVVFCVDVSQSMYGRGIEQARRELSRTIRELPASCAFEVVAFHERVMPFSGALEPAHPVVKARALAWIDALPTVSYTNIHDAVEAAFGAGGVGPRAQPGAPALDAVFLLSDGAPNRGRHRQADRLVAAVAALSAGGGRRVPVHTIGAGEEVFPLLRRIAAATGGTFVDAFEFGD